jgi:ATP phosphoribosyltransferase
MVAAPTYPINPAEIRTRIIEDLDLAHLSKDEQDQVIEALGEVLLERATYEIMRRIPDEDLEALDALAEDGTDEAMQEAIKKHVPDVEQVVMNAVREGIEEHKRLVAEEMERGQADQPIGNNHGHDHAQGHTHGHSHKQSLEDKYFAD